MQKVLLLTPPMTQLNTPYPATAYLTGFLRSRGIACAQADPAIELVLRLFSRAGLARARTRIEEIPAARRPKSVRRFLFEYDRYAATVEPVVRFLQGTDPSFALRVVSRKLLPEGPRFQSLYQFAIPDGGQFGDSAGGEPGPDVAQLQWAFGALGAQDQAKYLCSLYLDDLADVIRDGVDGRFEFSRYGEKLAASQAAFDPLLEALGERTLLDEMLGEIVAEALAREFPASEAASPVVALTAPFPGNVYGAFRIAEIVRRLRPDAKLALGGGYVNTELRKLKDPRVFDYFDALTFDDGERPLLCLLEYFAGARPRERLLRTMVRDSGGRVLLASDPRERDIPQKDTGTPTYDGLPIAKYLSLFELLNPMHRIWSDGRWNKLTLAHGCYWKKCNFCDVSLDYIGRYEASPADLVVDRMEALIRETGQSGFHFVDEAAPPALLRKVAEKLLERGVSATWWGNVRFEAAFTPELCELLARSGCVAFSGGLEVASPRLLELMNKGVTVEQVARVTRAMADAGILVHAYLMYGFPTQTAQETVDALERVRQLFETGCIQSAYWHRFSATVHSPIGRDPKRFGIELRPAAEISFAENDVPFVDPTRVDHAALGEGLKRALYNYMHGIGFDLDVREWFTEVSVPRATVRPTFIAQALVPPETAAGTRLKREEHKKKAKA